MLPARFPNGVELRAAIELRAAAGRRLEGYAAVFNVEARIGDFREVIRPGAFRKSLLTPGADILLLADHDPTRVLARTAAGNLVLSEDSKGLHFAATLPDTTAARDAWALVESRTAGGCSFGFRATAERWPARDQRELLDVALIEVSVVSAHPAYSQTTVSARSRAAAPSRNLRLMLECI